MAIAYEFLKEQGGINLAYSYRYRGRGEYQCSYNSKASEGKVLDFVEIESGNETLLKHALVHIGPIAVAIDASLPSFQNYKEGIYDDENCTSPPNHAGKYFTIKYLKFSVKLSVENS